MKQKIKASGFLFLLAPIFFFIVETIVIQGWSTGDYSRVYNFMSDLGVPITTEFEGRMVSSPLHNVMNAGFIIYALLFLLAFSFSLHAFSRKQKKIGIGLVSVYSLGILLVAFFPGYDWWGQPFHMIGAACALFIGNLALLFYGYLFQSFLSKKWFFLVSVLAGVFGVIASLILVLFAYDSQYSGLLERIGIYPTLIWSALLGILLLNHQKQR